MPTTSGVDPIVLGLRRMSERQRPGQCFTAAEIARELHVDEGTVRYTERQALAKVAQRLRADEGELLNELFGACPAAAVTARPKIVRVSRAVAGKTRTAAWKARMTPKQREAYLAKRRAAYAAATSRRAA
jgi:hypothetical protein